MLGKGEERGRGVDGVEREASEPLARFKACIHCYWTYALVAAGTNLYTKALQSAQLAHASQSVTQLRKKKKRKDYTFRR